MTRFYLGTHHPHWLSLPGPWFVSINSIQRMKKWPRAIDPWGMDSAAFTELSKHGKWIKTPLEYVSQVRRAREEIGNLAWCAPQDWMCEPFMLTKTGFDVQTHQRLTIQNFLDLRNHLGELVIPVLQGWSPWDYIRHVEMYEKAGINLRREETVGVGSICRRQHTAQACTIITLLHSEGIPIHAFGLKLLGLKLNHAMIKTGDSMAWSFAARRQNILLPGHTHKNCANCHEWAEQWRDKVKPYVT